MHEQLINALHTALNQNNYHVINEFNSSHDDESGVFAKTYAPPFGLTDDDDKYEEVTQRTDEQIYQAVQDYCTENPTYDFTHHINERGHHLIQTAKDDLIHIKACDQNYIITVTLSGQY